MAGFRCPSASLSSTSSTQNVQSQASRPPKPHPPSRRIRAVNIAKAEAAAKNAARLARARRNIPADSDYGLFIGNFPPKAEKKDLVDHFGGCGKITSTDIRCCGGVCRPTKPTPGVEYQNVRQYALMTFSTQFARSRALKLNGSVLDGYKLAVSLSISGLPELKQMIAERMNEYRSRFVTPDVHRAKKSVLKSLDEEPTILLDPTAHHGDRKRAHAVILNHSFRMTVI